MRSARNRFVRVARRVRNPRYAIALLVGVAYFALIFGTGRGEGPFVGSGARVVLPVLVILFVLWSWLWGGYRRALALSPAEAQMLLPAPVPKRALMLYQILRAQIGVLISAVLFTLLSHGTGAPWPLRVPAYFVFFSTLTLHQFAASLVHAAATEQGTAGLRRNRVAIVLFVLAAGILAVTLAGAAGALREAASLRAALAVLSDAFRQPLASAVLLPFRWMAGPIVATGAQEWLHALPGALLLWALHALWVLRTDAAFEEAAWEASRARARRLERRRERAPLRNARRRSHRLPAAGHPAVAILWKNVIQLRRRVRPGALLLGIVAVAFGLGLGAASAGSAARAIDGIAIGAGFFAALLTLVGPLAFRNDLRADFAHLALLRTWPVPARTLVGVQIASSALAITVVQALLLLVALAALALGVALGGDPGRLALALRVAPVVFVLPLANGLATTIHNAFVLLFPGWVAIGADRPGGIEHIGQRLLTLFGSAILLVLGLLPAALVTLAALSLIDSTAVALVTAGLGAAALLATETSVLLGWLGRLFERTDPSTA